MKSILYTELASDFLVEGLGLHIQDNSLPVGKVGRSDMELVSTLSELISFPEEIQVLYLGKAEPGPFRAGDVLMAGSDELLDRAFQALDVMEQRGVVVGLSNERDAHQVTLVKDGLYEMVINWKERKIPYLCLFLVEPVDSEGTAKLVGLIRKVLA
ncbi:hypothetical protein [Desulfitobacterium metallireducens]|uniref:Uncharacterized protein n=1 Tax=Desulfitobacterium metallireducens DSM 15288 TaxID=871968 RepID=W0EAC9_9FIRM|nr:hypothetical protein [Desulfitobacterium metallireducens]AHF07697.1 hypothetical protein DESME_12240 [Desulfitobacterium metallireducens DSM 15288]